ncbi:PREDICTED: receptor-like protein kinase FERONIA [Theobroma cacao]|uniref:Receptor-like protein kinase FERONIA n=2 Tax=Theobroma cacao TaxID=3641 RepID=A0AB32WBE9_THECC|nr:PREDICTED: receptor-like protein kinase FERONIA [Theobroma cacao]EOY03740.1 Malectin/receptor-like protein kinase family protein, putative [Theobroma cacao]
MPAMKNMKKVYVSLQKLSIPAPFYFMLLLQNLNISAAYTPPDNIALDCGSVSNNNDSTPRLWLGDDKYLDQPKNTEAVMSNVSGTKTDPIPYNTARLSHSHFSYTFNVTPGQKFVRLHFYPTSYGEFNRSTAFFDVHIGRYTLLSNFSAALTADDCKSETFSKEFCVNVEDSERKLTILFTASRSMPDSYAFINGIEIVSMPDNLYYSADNDTGFKFVNQENPYRIEKNMALEMVYRINVGGSFVSPAGDTGMYRSWSDDNKYLTDARPSALPVNLSRELNFSMIPNYTAPVPIYTTARTMGTNKTMNENYRLTWQFQVDSGFTYLVRLHFCEFQNEIVAAANRVFQIYINNLVAESQADVVSWAEGTGIPVIHDYAVMIGSGGKAGNQKRTNLSISLHPAPAWMTNYSDAILNGLEIFKLSNDGNLTGPNPDPVPVPAGTPGGFKPTRRKNSVHKIIFSIVGGIALCFVSLSLLCFLRKMRVKNSGSTDGSTWWSQFSSKTKSSRSSLPSDLCRYFSLAEIKAATNDFDNVFVIGVGGFGNVYKGFIDGGAKQVAIKRLNPESEQGALEFKTEIEMLSQLRHLHLVSLIGYCNDAREMILVYNFMARGSLRDHLYKTDNPPLPWKQRLEICIGAARGLQYLHTGAKHTIIHRDVKTTNILLDEKWVAKVSDFGLSKLGPTNVSKAHVTTVVKGSLGYLDPEYYRRQQLTEKSDVYSFGVVLCEVLCARPPINRTADKEQASLATWAQECYRNGTLDQFIDPFLRGKIASPCFKKFTEVAMSCLVDEGTERPSMSDVVWSLEFALQLQRNAEGEINCGNNQIEVDVEDETHLLTDASGEVFSSIGEHVLMSRTTFSITSDEQSITNKDFDEVLRSRAVFSEIRNPQGR